MQQKFIDFIDGIQKDRYIIYDNGNIFDTTIRKILPINKKGQVHLHRSKRLTPYSVDRLTLMAFKGIPMFDINSRFIWVYHRNGDCCDYRLDNLEWALKHSDLSVEDVVAILDILQSGEKDNEVISRKLGRFVSSETLLRIIRNANKIAEILNHSYDCKNNNNTKRANQLTEEQVIEICKLLVKTPDVKLVAEMIPFATYRQIEKIYYKLTYKTISDKFFTNINELREKHILEISDSDDEKWKIVPSHLLNEMNDVIHVSSKGRFINNTGHKITPYVDQYGFLVIGLNQKIFRCSRLVLCTFGLDLPHTLGFPYTSFSIRYKDDDKRNISIENLYWAPRYCDPNSTMGAISIKKMNEFCDKLKTATHRGLSKEMRETLREELMEIMPYNKMIDLTVGKHYAYYTRAFETLEWRKCVGVDGEYYVSSNGIIRYKKMTMLLTHSTPDDERNYVTINGKEYLVCKLVLKAFKPRSDYKNYFPKHINGDLKDDRVDNLDWEYLSPETKIGKLKWRYHISEELKPIDWIPGIDPSRYQLSNLGRIFDTKRKRFIPSHINHDNRKVCNVSSVDGKTIIIYIGTSVIRCFRPDAFEKLPRGDFRCARVLYLDGDTSNCTVKNLMISIKAVNKLDLNGQLIKHYDSVEQAVTENSNLNLNKNTLRSHMNKNQTAYYGKPYKGFLWEYVEKIY